MQVTFQINGRIYHYHSASDNRYLEAQLQCFHNLEIFHEILDCPEDTEMEGHWVQRCKMATKAYSVGALSGYCPEYPGHSEKAMKRLAFFLKCCCWMHDHDSDFHNWLMKILNSNDAIDTWSNSSRHDTSGTMQRYPQYNFFNE